MSRGAEPWGESLSTTMISYRGARLIARTDAMEAAISSEQFPIDVDDRHLDGGLWEREEVTH